MKRIILCADDYGQNTYISQAIIDLIKEKRLSATSCMSTSPHWLTHAKWLEPYKDSIDIGLHWNLTEGNPLSKEYAMKYGKSFHSLNSLIIKSHLRKLEMMRLETELHMQIDQFIAGMGQLPDFIDGHQHIHQLPVVRQALMRVYEKRLQQSGCYVRSVNNTSAYWSFHKKYYLKKLIIQLCGSVSLKNALVKHQIPHNDTFSGIYDFKSQYVDNFSTFLAEIGDKGIIMCHPGLENSIESDLISNSRYREYQFLKSSRFWDECSLQKIKLVRFIEK